MEFERTSERTVGEKVFDILGMSELADAYVHYGPGMTAAEYVGERGHPDAVETFTTFAALHEALIEGGYDPEEVPEFVQMREGHIRAMRHRLNATYDENLQRWVVIESSEAHAGTRASR